ncbi:LLM class flavin-dependent oxidoreductase [Catenuloplanes atrovinosus]|uniref:Alkanesulfonate monooxygenase SsuD/methylene tetrahydromethanopterin reductase-like flavin-dependent oxidoreductase (Luciferase family) n=1 Tax=Catenuloplanes atrovinosus TaxID=137266 RepID=A0AAE3YP01_9ACTN|nr:LLM class flavin-dependent oxidoreductase [Catenuloplanes atrovinosus]MDR7275748.1 alkanesulfonate monooxygenase SsuD/methylene tetrahydromethanopterin reductase-like flavin-dependent oxidoreductase (luciferase family) [Catenuloplanes atrovinosus]
MTHLHLAAALDGAGWHPAAWRLHTPALFTAGWWTGLVAEAERGLLDFVTIEDSLALRSEPPGVAADRAGRVRGRLDAALIAARVAPTTTRIGIVPTITTTHTEPFHIASAVATLDYVSTGRAGWRAQVSGLAAEARHIGRREVPVLDPALPPDRIAEVLRPLFDEAADVIEVVRRLWDSWEDDAIIRDVATGRFVDNRKLHYVDFAGEFFSVKGPSIVPRPPQGQPLVTVLGHATVPYRLGVRGADVLYVTPGSAAGARSVVAEVRRLERAERRAGVPVKVFGDLVVFLDPEPGAAARRRRRLDELDGAEPASDAFVFAGTPGELADLLAEWHAAGLDGFRLRPGVLPDDLVVIARELTAQLRARGLFRHEYPGTTLRATLGLERPASRYAGSRA